MTAVIIAFINIFALIMVERLAKRWSFPPYYYRKFLHVATAAIVYLFIPFVSYFEYLVLTGFFVIVYASRYFLKPIDAIEPKTYISYGSFLYPIGLFIMGAFLFADQEILQLGILILGIPDVLASLIDQKLNKKRKTALGRGVYMIAVGFISYFFLLPLESLVLAIVLTVIEWVSYKGFDNFTVPLGYILFMLFQF